MILYEWRCRFCDNKFDEFAKVETRDMECPKCGGLAKRIVSAPRFDPKMGLDPDFRTFSDKWANRQNKAAREAQRRADEHGDEY